MDEHRSVIASVGTYIAGALAAISATAFGLSRLWRVWLAFGDWIEAQLLRFFDQKERP